MSRGNVLSRGKADELIKTQESLPASDSLGCLFLSYFFLHSSVRTWGLCWY